MLVHGGDITGFAQNYGREPVDFSVNTNPLGFSPKAREALLRAADRACQYPDPLYRRLRRAIGEFENIPDSWVACGNGAADIIWRAALALRPKKALVTAPTFSEYQTALEYVSCRTERYLLRRQDSFCLREDILDSITPDTDVIFICSPNNPTGLAAKKPLLLQILKRCRQYGVTAVVDECFMGFVRSGAELTLKDRLGEYPRLVILKAFTKIYGMAGFRLGYCLCSDTGLLEKIRDAGQCWPVSVAAEEAGIAALSDTDFVQKALDLVGSERERLRRGLEELGLEPFASDANFLLFYTSVPHFGEKMAQKGFLIRDCSNYAGLGEGFYRIAVLTPEKNGSLLEAIKEIVR